MAKSKKKEVEVVDVLAECVGASKVKPKKGEDRQEYLVRLAAACNNDLDEEVWDSLPESAQDWVEKAVKAIKGKKPLDDPDAVEEEPEAEEEEEEEEEEAEEADADSDEDEVEEEEEEADEEEEEEEEEAAPPKKGKKGAKKEAAPAKKEKEEKPVKKSREKPEIKRGDVGPKIGKGEVPGITSLRNRLFYAGALLKKNGLEYGVTEKGVKELNKLFGLANDSASECQMRFAWHAVNGFLHASKVK